MSAYCKHGQVPYTCYPAGIFQLLFELKGSSAVWPSMPQYQYGKNWFVVCKSMIACYAQCHLSSNTVTSPLTVAFPQLIATFAQSLLKMLANTRLLQHGLYMCMCLCQQAGLHL